MVPSLYSSPHSFACLKRPLRVKSRRCADLPLGEPHTRAALLRVEALHHVDMLDGRTRLLSPSPCFKAAVAERDSEHAGLLSEGTWTTLKGSRDVFDRRFVFRVLFQLFHISTGPITTNNAFSRGNSPGHQLLLFISQALIAQLLAHECIELWQRN